jgi:serine/threonine protein phosphatase PrpC
MKDVVKKADLNIFNHSKEDEATRGMGTTIVMAWILNDKAYVCWCGDSRCYVLNKQHGLIQLSKDHSYVQELVDKGELNPELMHDHPLSNVITRCLGDVENRADPETRIYQLHNDDIIMLCSDGLCGICHDDVILDTMIKFHEDPIECKNELISAALSAGGYDNVTIALANIQTDEEIEEEQQSDEQKSEEKEREQTEEENLSTTVRSEVIGHRVKNKRNRIFLILLFIIIGFTVYLLIAKDSDPVKQAFMTAIMPYWEKLMNHI